jgi:hypothetical protein
MADDPMVARHGLKRLFLHARSLAFRGPGTGKEISVEAPMGDDLARPLGHLRADIDQERLRGPGAVPVRPGGRVA